jgi:hypothetical protein
MTFGRKGLASDHIRGPKLGYETGKRLEEKLVSYLGSAAQLDWRKMMYEALGTDHWGKSLRVGSQLIADSIW